MSDSSINRPKSYIPASQDGAHLGFRYWQLVKTQTRNDAMDSRLLYRQDKALTLYLPLWLRDSGDFRSGDAYGHLATKYGAIWTPQGQSFDGVDDKVSIPNNAVLDGSPITVICICKPDTLSVDQRMVVTFNAATNRGFQMFYYADAPNKFWWQAGDGVSWPGAFNIGSATHSVLKWYHVAGVVTDSQALIYVDGLLENSSNANAISPSASPLEIGDSTGYPLAYDGLISEVFIYKRALSHLEVQDHYIMSRRRLPWLS